MYAAAKIRELIKEAHDMRRHHGDLFWGESASEERKQFHGVKVRYYDGQLVALERALNAVLEEAEV
jgi:hypothetical protein